MKRLSLVLVAGFAVFGQMFAQAPAPAPAEDLEEVLTAIAPAVRKSDPMGDVDLPSDLPRFQKADALPIDLAMTDKKVWNKTVAEAEKVVKQIKDLPKLLKKLNELSSKLRSIYEKASK